MHLEFCLVGIRYFFFLVGYTRIAPPQTHKNTLEKKGGFDVFAVMLTNHIGFKMQSCGVELCPSVPDI